MTFLHHWIDNYFYCKVTKIFVNRSNLLKLNIYDTIPRYSSQSPTKPHTVWCSFFFFCGRRCCLLKKNMINQLIMVPSNYSLHSNGWHRVLLRGSRRNHMTKVQTKFSPWETNDRHRMKRREKEIDSVYSFSVLQCSDKTLYYLLLWSYILNPMLHIRVNSSMSIT